MQFVDERPAAPYEIRIYRGANGAFTLYEDAGDGYGYEHGEFALVALSWNEACGELTIGARQGKFPELVANREYRLIFISAQGREIRIVNYIGAEMNVSV
jgi:alpha-D-xyloside xylohydrolase